MIRIASISAVALLLALPATAAFMGVPPSSDAPPPATPWNSTLTTDIGDNEVDLFALYNHLYGTSLGSQADLEMRRVTPDELFMIGPGRFGEITAEARYASLEQEFGYYQTLPAGGLTLTELFTVTDVGLLSPESAFTATFNPVGLFGFYNDTGPFFWHSESGRNMNFEDHMVMYSTPFDDTYMLAWEDKPFDLSDRDYNDLVLTFSTPVIPEPGSMLLLGVGAAGLLASRKLRRK